MPVDSDCFVLEFCWQRYKKNSKSHGAIIGFIIDLLLKKVNHNTITIVLSNFAPNLYIRKKNP